MRRQIVPCVVLAATLLAARTTRADEESDSATRRQLTATLTSGTLLPEDHVYKLGGGYSMPPTIYVGLSFEGDLTRRVRLECSLGAEVALGWVITSSVRYVPLSGSGFSLGLGAGPILTIGSMFGTGVFGAGNVEARYVFPKTPFVVALNVGIAFALNDAGTISCGTDTCNAYIRHGDRLENVVASLGYAFDL
jgi:hypothetical protein